MAYAKKSRPSNCKAAKQSFVSSFDTYVYLEPKFYSCFDWKLDLVLEGSNPKIEDKQVPDVYTYKYMFYYF